MSYLLPPILYLESKDFTSSGNLKYFKNNTCVIMIQANYCNHCTDAKPHFQNFANNNKSVVCLTLQGDDAGQKLNDLITKIKPTFNGFPDYVLFKNGKCIKKEISGRTETALQEFIN